MDPTSPAIVGLARVSTHAQDTQLQLDALRDAGCTQIFEEHVSTRSTARPGLEAALAVLRPGDTLAVWKLDRLGRSVKDVLIIADDLHARGSVFGRPRVISPAMATEIRARRAGGETLISIAKSFGVSRTSVSRCLDDDAVTRAPSLSRRRAAGR